MPRPVLKSSVTTLVAGALMVMLGSCGTPEVVAPRPAPRPVVVMPLPPQPAPADWRDAAQTAGDWTWSIDNGRSTARFGRSAAASLVQVTCDRPANRVLLRVSGNASAAVPMTVRTTSTLRPLASDPALSPAGWVVVALGARDPLLDAIAFSRGRFAIEVAGLAPLYLPAWPEISRVIEDCR